MSSDRQDVRVDYYPHRVRAAGGAYAKDLSIAPRDVAVVRDVAHVRVYEAEIVSEAVETE